MRHPIFSSCRGRYDPRKRPYETGRRRGEKAGEKDGGTRNGGPSARRARQGRSSLLLCPCKHSILTSKCELGGQAPYDPQAARLHYLKEKTSMREIVKRLSVRMNEKEYAHLKKLTEASGLKMEPLIRKLIMGQEIHQRPPAEMPELLRQMSAIGNNINQIAKVANSSKFVRQEDIKEIQKMQSDLWKAVRHI